MHRRGYAIEFLGWCEPIRADGLPAVLDFLEEARHPDFDEFVLVICRKELHALQQRIARVARLFQNTVVERQPLQVTVPVEAGIAQ